MNDPGNYKTSKELKEILDNPNPPSKYYSLFNKKSRKSNGARVSAAKFYSRGNYNKKASFTARTSASLRRSQNRRDIVNIVNRKSNRKTNRNTQNKLNIRNEIMQLNQNKQNKQETQNKPEPQNWLKNLFGLDSPPLKPIQTQYPIKKPIQSNPTNLLGILTQNNFQVVPNDGGGDCFFLTISEGLKSYNSTYSQNLRKLVSSNTTTQMFAEYDNQQWQLFIANDRRGITYIGQIYGDNYNKNNVNRIRQELSKPMNKQNNNEINNLIYTLHNPKLFPTFKLYLESSNYWADTLAVTLLRRLLNVQFIIFDSNQNNINCILNENNNKNNYNGYILIWWTSPTHYELIIYNNPTDNKQYGFFTFATLPPIIKNMINSFVIKSPECNNDVKFPII